MGLIALFIIIPMALVLGLVLPIVAIIDILRSKFYGNENILMLLLVIFVPFGFVLYFIIAPSRKLANR